MSFAKKTLKTPDKHDSNVKNNSSNEKIIKFQTLKSSSYSSSNLQNLIIPTNQKSENSLDTNDN